MHDSRGRGRGPADALAAGRLPPDVDGRNIGAAEVLADEQEWLAAGHSQGVGEAIAEVQPGGMATLSVAPPGRSGDLDLFGIDRNHLNFSAVQEKIQLAPSWLPPSSLDDQSALQDVAGGHQPVWVALDRNRERSPLRLVEEHRKNSRAVEDHQRGRPCSS